MKEVNKRLIRGDEIIYPITNAGNIIGLQGTIKEKLPIVSPSTPQQGVERQAWIKIGDNEEYSEEELAVGFNPQLEQPPKQVSQQLEEYSTSAQLEEEISTQLEENDEQSQKAQLEEN